MFGLKIVARTCPQVYRLFEFDIEEYISFSEMGQMLKLPIEAAENWTRDDWSQLLKKHTIMELSIV